MHRTALLRRIAYQISILPRQRLSRIPSIKIRRRTAFFTKHGHCRRLRESRTGLCHWEILDPEEPSLVDLRVDAGSVEAFLSPTSKDAPEPWPLAVLLAARFVVPGTTAAATPCNSCDQYDAEEDSCSRLAKGRRIKDRGRGTTYHSQWHLSAQW
jgi:hypothetical protein